MRVTPEGCIFYTLDEAEQIELETYDIYIHEFLLIFFALDPEKPISVEKVHETLYSFYEELKKKGYKVQDLCFVTKNNKPYSKHVEWSIINLWYSNYIEVDSNNRLRLTKKGKNEAISILKEKIREKDLDDLIGFRKRVLT